MVQPQAARTSTAWRYVAKESMSKILIYGAGLIVIAFVVGLLLFLTFENAFSGRAIYGTENGSFFVSGFPAILVNFGILSLISSLISYLVFLYTRRSIYQKAYKRLTLLSGILISIGLLIPTT